MTSKNITGMKFGRLTAQSVASKNPTTWKCVCDCGNVNVVRTASLISGNTKSCGCLKIDKIIECSTTHGGSGTRLYDCWSDMKKRCYNPNAKFFKNYGGRGVRVYKPWMDYAIFRDWALSHGYADNLTLERLNVFGNYEPANCCWITKRLQHLNKRSRRDVVRSDGTLYLCIRHAAVHSGVSEDSVSSVLGGRSKSSGGYSWKYRDKMIRVDTFPIPESYRSKAIIRDDGMKFECIRDAASYCELPYSTFRNRLNTDMPVNGHFYYRSSALRC